MNILATIRRAWRRLWQRRRFEKVVWIESRGELPARLKDALYVVGKPKPKWVALECPCGCGERLDVNLMNVQRDKWQLSIQNNKVTLWPSLWVPEDKCGSHFWIKANRIIWV